MDQHNQHDDSWVCMGTCQAVISKEQHDGGLTACGADVCTMKGQPFVKGHKSEATGQNEKAEEMPAGTA